MYIQWSPAFEIGVPRIDAEHRHLAGIVNAFYDVFRADGGRSRIFAVLNLLCQYAETHFRDEEELMGQGRYPGLARHRLEHDRLLREVFALNERYAAGEAEITEEVMGFLKHWLLSHILQEDKKLEAHFESVGR